MGGRRDRYKQLAPQQILLCAAGFATLAVLIGVYLALQPPWLGIDFEPATHRSGVEIAGVDPEHPNATQLSPGVVVTALVTGQGNRLAITRQTLMEEPDVLPSYSRFNEFLAHQDALSEGLDTPPLYLELGDGRTIPVTQIERPMLILPLYFWWQVLIGAACMVIGAAVWAYRRGQSGPQLLLVSGVSALGFAVLAAVYSSRELALDGELWRTISALTHLFTLTHVAALLALIWIYPRPLGRGPVPGIIFASAGVAWLLDGLQITPSAVWSHYLYANVAFVVGLLFVGGQWLATRDRPVERAIMQWFVLAIFVGSVVNVALLKAPLLFGARPLVGQGWVFVAHLLMYMGLALGVMRYRLFDLERWWFKAWLWFFAGLAVIGIDLAVFLVLGVGRTQSLILALVVAGWLYFPARQWAWSRLAKRSGGEIPELVPKLTMRLISADSTDQIHAGWLQALSDIFAPLKICREPFQGACVSIEEDGLLLRVPSLDGSGGLALYYPDHGKRLFRPLDVERTELFLDIARNVVKAARAREDGARSERERIMRDLHDDLGARLLSLVYAADNEKGQYLARAALDDLHGVLASAHGDPVELSEAVELWCAECTRRVEEAGISGSFTTAAAAAREARLLSARVQVNVGRITREAVSNAIRHSCAGRVSGTFTYQDGTLSIIVTDDGCGGIPAEWESGHGLRTMQTRAREIGAELQWQRPVGGGCQVRLLLPLDPQPNRQAGARLAEESLVANQP